MEVETLLGKIKLKGTDLKMHCCRSVAMASLKSMNYDIAPIEEALYAMKSFRSLN